MGLVMLMSIKAKLKSSRQGRDVLGLNFSNRKSRII